MATPSLLRLLVLLTAGAAVLQVAAWVDCGDASPSPPPSSSTSPSPLSPPANGSSSNAPFRANLLMLLSALPRAAAPTGFASLSLGAGRDRAFVRGLCRGDFQPPRCLADLQEAVRTLGGSCPSSRRAAVWLDVYVAYADTNASTPREDDFRMLLYDTRLVAEPAAYLKAYGALMRNLVARAVGVGGGGGEAGTTARQFFATGEAQYASDDPNGTMYGMVQCMRDITAADCDRCLQASVPQLPCCKGNQGGVVLAYNCFLRIQVYTYYDLALDAPPSAAEPPSPTPAGETSGTGRPRNTIILAVVVPLGTILLAFVCTTGVYLRRRRGVNERRSRPPDVPYSRAPPRGRAKDDRSATYVHPEKFTLPVLRVATGNFAAENKLGEGGFGEVFKFAGQASGWTSRCSKKALQGLLSRLPRAEKRAHSRRQADTQEPGPASWGLPGGNGEADRVRVPAKSEPGHHPFRETAAASSGLEQEIHDHQRDRARPAVPPRGVPAADHPPGPQAQQRPAGFRHDSQDLGFRTRQSVLGRRVQRGDQTTCWNPRVHVPGVRVLRARLDQIRHVQLRGHRPRDRDRPKEQQPVG
ncbi:cysteine-rich receptor-like protein kinase 34 isoform X2 [Miscanthus floridulus]|uniref:cysteine-rich receptor-like protein kinase 34 isoform X2 n=1 Tax=Miscanthus floridulus TaxID=154761 RepID=UPI0034588AF7